MGDVGGSSKRLKEHQGQLQWVEGLLVSAEKREWFGNITIQIKRGMIDSVLLAKSLKPPKMPENGG